MTLDEAVQTIAGKLASEGITKSRSLPGGQGKFRGIDEVQKATCQLMATHGVTVFPCGVRDVRREERQNKNGGLLLYSVVTYSFMVRGHGDQYVGEVVSEAFDTGDKGLSKVGSVAYREFLLKLFNVPTEGQPERDEEHHEPAPRHKDVDVKLPPAEQSKGADEPRFPARWDYEQGEWGGRAMREAEPYVLTTYIAECHKWLNAPGLSDTRRLTVTLSKESAEHALEIALTNEAAKKG